MKRDSDIFNSLTPLMDNPALSLRFKLFVGLVSALTIEHENTRREAVSLVSGADIPDLGHWESSPAARIFGSLLGDDLSHDEVTRTDGGLMSVLWKNGSSSANVERYATLARVLAKMDVDTSRVVTGSEIRTRDIILAMSWLKDGQDDWMFWDDCMEDFIRQANSVGNEWVL